MKNKNMKKKPKVDMARLAFNWWLMNQYPGKLGG